MTTDTIRTPSTDDLWHTLDLLEAVAYNHSGPEVRREISQEISEHWDALRDLASGIDGGTVPYWNPTYFRAIRPNVPEA